jgi:hypothetical protein
MEGADFRKRIVTIATVEAAVLIGAVAFFVLTRDRTPDAPASSPSIPVEAGENDDDIIAIGVTGDLTDWKMYRSEVLGITFAYPPEYTLHESPHSAAGSVVLLDRAEKPRQVQERSDGSPEIAVLVQGNHEHLSAIDWARANPDVSQFGSTYQSGTYRFERIAGIRALRYEAKGVGHVDYAILTRGDRVFALTAAWLGEDDAFLDDFGMMLMTLQFTEPT